jgi:hypothetical protein
MTTVAGLFRDRDRALRAVDELGAAGFGQDTVTLVSSPTSAAEVVGGTARHLERPGGGFIDLGAALGGQAERSFPEEERVTFEERVAQGDTLLRVDAPDPDAAGRALVILRQAGAERVSPGTIRD